jgi:hypothetical protein
VKQDEMRNTEETDSSQWEVPILEEIDVALLTQNNSGVGPGGGAPGTTHS